MADGEAVGEFAARGKLGAPASVGEAQQRLTDNLPHFAGNYAVLFCALCVAGVLVHPLALAALVATAGLYAGLFVQQVKSIGPVRIPASPNARLGAFGVAAFVLLYATDAVGVIGSWAVFAAVASLGHAALRVSAKEPDFESPVNAV